MVILVFHFVEEEEQVEEIKEDAEEAIAEGMQWFSAKPVLGDTFWGAGVMGMTVCSFTMQRCMRSITKFL